MSDSPPNHLGLDAELFQLMLEYASIKPRLWILISEIQSRLNEKIGREVTVEEIAQTVKTTQYTQRDFQGRRTNILPYNEAHRDGKLHQLMMHDQIATDSAQWGW